MKYKRVEAGRVVPGDQINTDWSDGWDDYPVHGTVLFADIVDGYGYPAVRIETCNDPGRCSISAPERGDHGGIVFQADAIVAVAA